MTTQKERYWSDAEYRQRILEYVKKYNKTEKGKIANARSREKRKLTHPDWNKAYSKKRRDYARQNKICTRCYKTYMEEDYLMCNKCIEYSDRYREIIRGRTKCKTITKSM